MPPAPLPDELQAFIDKPRHAVVGTVRADSTPVTTPCWYGVDAQLEDTAISRLPFTGTLANVAPNEAVAQVAATMGLLVEVDSQRVILRPDPRKAPRTP